MDMQPQRDKAGKGGQRPLAAPAMSGTARHAAFLLAWLLLMGLMYLAVERYLSPPKAVVTAEGDLRIPRARNGHFYIQGTVNGTPVEFLVDTGASAVVVSEAVAKAAGLGPGTPTVFRTAGGTLRGRVVSGVPVTAGPLALSSTTVGVGLVSDRPDQALLGQSFLSRFSVSITGNEMVIRKD